MTSTTASIVRKGVSSYLDLLYKDPDRHLTHLMDWADEFSRGEFASQRAAIRSALINPNDPYFNYTRRILNNVDKEVMKTIAINFFLTANLEGEHVRRRYREQYNCNIPWAILIDPTTACNLHCIGCWAADYGHRMNLTFEEMDSIVRQGKELGVYFYMFTGGEPLMRKTDIIRLCERHNDCVFSAFTNGTLIDMEFADEMLRVKNFVPAISLEGFQEATDSRRGEGVYEIALKAMKLLHRKKLVYGVSYCYTSQNYRSLTSKEYWEMMIKNGAYFAWFFHYMPVGNDADIRLLPNPEQRAYVYHHIRSLRSENPIFAIDFQNDGEFVGGCVAGGRSYLHINANGDVEPCAFIHYADTNIKREPLLEALKSPLFMAYYTRQPFNENMLRPCPMLENPEKLRKIVDVSGAHSTEMRSPESVEHLCSKCDTYASAWKQKADKLWETRRKEKLLKNL